MSLILPLTVMGAVLGDRRQRHKTHWDIAEKIIMGIATLWSCYLSTFGFTIRKCCFAVFEIGKTESGTLVNLVQHIGLPILYRTFRRRSPRTSNRHGGPQDQDPPRRPSG